MTHSLSRITPWAAAKWVAALCIAIVMVFPIWWMFNVVFADPGIPVSLNPRLYPTSLSAGIENISRVLSETGYMRAYYISVAYTVLTIAGVLLVGSMAAFEFALFDFPGKRIFFALVMLSLMVPTAATLIPTYLFVAKLGWLNTMQGPVVPGLASAFGLFMLTQFMKSIPREMLEAARLDGATHFQLYWFIALPLSKTALVTLAILTFMKTWGNFIWPLVISQRPEMFTVSGGQPVQRAPFPYDS